MSRELILFDPHGGHCRLRHKGEYDDGAKSPRENVLAAHRMGVVQTITSHNTLDGVQEYLDAMASVGWKHVAVPGVEFRFSLNTYGGLAYGEALARDSEYLMLGPSQRKFIRGKEASREGTKKISSRELLATKKKLEKTILDGLHVTSKEEAVRLLKRAVEFSSFQQAFDVAPRNNRDQQALIDNCAGLWAALTQPGFATFYYLLHTEDFLQKLGDSHHIPKDRLDQFRADDSLATIAFFGKEFYSKKITQGGSSGRTKGEIVCLMPPQKSLVGKVARVADYWRENGFTETESLHSLIDVLKTKLTEGEYRSLIKYVPHILSIDASIVGQIITRVFQREKLALFSPEFWVAEIASEIDAVEDINGAHPHSVNAASTRVTHNDALKDKAHCAGSDSHYPGMIGCATLLEVDTISSEGILAAFRQRRTHPVDGWCGPLRLDWAPLLAWSTTPGIIYDKFGPFKPDLILNKIREGIDLKTAARQTITELGLEGDLHTW